MIIQIFRKIVTQIGPIISMTTFIKSFTVNGMFSSITFISFENLFIILPIGLVSKNLMRVDNIELNIFLCTYFDALIDDLKNKSVFMMLNTTADPTKTLKIITLISYSKAKLLLYFLKLTTIRIKIVISFFK